MILWRAWPTTRRLTRQFRCHEAIGRSAGVSLIHRFHWILYVFGAFLVITGVKMALHKDKQIHPERNIVLKLVHRLGPVASAYEGQRVIVRREGRSTPRRCCWSRRRT